MKKTLMLILLIAICVYARHKHYESSFCPAGGHRWTSNSWYCDKNPCEDDDAPDGPDSDCGGSGCNLWPQ